MADESRDRSVSLGPQVAEAATRPAWLRDPCVRILRTASCELPGPVPGTLGPQSARQSTRVRQTVLAREFGHTSLLFLSVTPFNPMRRKG